MNKKVIGLLSLLLLVFLLASSACDVYSPAYINDTPPIKVNITSGSVSVVGSINATVPNPLPVTGTVNATVPNPLPVNINGVTTIEDARLGVMSKDYFVGVAEGDIGGHTAWTKLGYHPAVTAAETTIWEVGTAYVFPVAAQGMEVRSSSTNDDGSPAGTGALTVKIWYLTNTFVEKTEIITLDGTTNVNTVNTDIFRINYFQVASVGAGATKTALGNIDIRNKTDHTTVYSRIAAGYNRARSTVYTVPALKDLYITDVSLSAAYKSAGKSVRITGQSTYGQLDGSTYGFFIPFMEIMLVDNVYSHSFNIPQKFIAGTDLKFSVIGEADTQSTAVLRGWLE